MTDDELKQLIADCPDLYHMAESGSWPSIMRHGLLSTSALLDLYAVPESDRFVIEGQRRPTSVAISAPSLGQVVVRDQKPIDDAGLARCLRDGLTPAEWYRLLNVRVFFWLNKNRLLALLDAKAYRGIEHDVLELDTRKLIDAYRDRITLSPINSGAKKPFPAPRGRSTLVSIEDYPYAAYRHRKRADRVVELSVVGGVPDVQRFVRRVLRMRGAVTTAVVWES